MQIILLSNSVYTMDINLFDFLKMKDRIRKLNCCSQVNSYNDAIHIWKNKENDGWQQMKLAHKCQKTGF